MPDTPDLAQRFAALAALGFERVEDVSVQREVVPVDGRSHRVVHSRPAMGTLASVSVLSGSAERADEAIGRAFDEMDRLVGIFSHYDGSSAASLLNTEGRIERPPRELARVVLDAMDFHRLTRGGFDISVAPVVELFRSRGDGSLPEVAEVRAALELVGAGHIAVSDRRIGFGRRGMRVTLDGIAKGYIVDAMAAVLERYRIRNYLVEAGGDIRARGVRERRRPWRVAIQDPEKGGVFPDTIDLSGRAVATSGSYESFFDPERAHHHIVYADTGSSPGYSSSVTVSAPTAMAADALATSVFLMEPRAGVGFVDALRGCECLIVRRDGTQLKSKGWRSAAPLNKGEVDA
jgi:thiamine biosynthesis lipoprotein